MAEATSEKRSAAMRNEDELPAPVSGQRHEVASAVGRLTYYSASTGSREADAPLLLIHSINAAGSAYEISPLYEHYRKTRTVYALELPGFGHSERGKRTYTIRMMTDAIHKMVEIIRQDHGIANLPASCRPGIYAARALYAEIGRELERRGLDSVSRRAIVSTRRKLSVLARTLALLQTEWTPARKLPFAFGEMQETRFLVDAIVSAAAPQSPRARSVEDRVVWVIELFERLERRDQIMRGRVPS